MKSAGGLCACAIAVAISICGCGLQENAQSFATRSHLDTDRPSEAEWKGLQIFLASKFADRVRVTDHPSDIVIVVSNPMPPSGADIVQQGAVAVKSNDDAAAVSAIRSVTARSARGAYVLRVATKTLDGGIYEIEVAAGIATSAEEWPKTTAVAFMRIGLSYNTVEEVWCSKDLSGGVF